MIKVSSKLGESFDEERHRASASRFTRAVRRKNG